MEIRRYLNGKQISKEALSSLAAVTPELETAVRAAQKRVEEDQKASAVMQTPPEAHG